MNVRVIPNKREFAPLAKRLGRKKALDKYAGPWAVDYYCPVTKKRKNESFTTKREATARKKEIEGKAETGEYRPLHKRSWAEFKAEYLEKIMNHQPHGTRRLYNQAIAAFERLCSPATMQALTTRVIDEFKSKRARDTKGQDEDETEISPNTVNKNLRHLRAMFRVANRWGYLPILPEFKLLKTPDREPRAIPSDVFDKILAATSKLDDRIAKQKSKWNGQGGADCSPDKKPCADWWVPFLSVAYLAGLRWEEILNLKWSDLRFTAKPEIKVWNQKAGRYETIPMSTTLFARLKAWMGTCANVADNALVFTHACHVRSVNHEWKQLQALAKIVDAYRFHDLRVSFCTNLVAASVQAPVLMKLARHRSIATTMQFYRGKTEDADRKAVEMMEAAFAKVENEANV